MIKGAFDISDPFRNKVKIYDGGFYRGVTQQSADGIYISSLGKQMSGKCVTKGVNAPASIYAGFFFAF